MHACPHCQANVFSEWTKASLGPARKTKCPSCRRNVGTPWGKSMVALSPFLAGILSVGYWPFPIAVIALVVGGAAMLYLSLKWVPLVKR